MAAGPAAVLVVGAGPVGLLAAVQLQRRGVAFRLVDKKRGLTPLSKSRAIVLHPPTLQVASPRARAPGGSAPPG